MHLAGFLETNLILPKGLLERTLEKHGRKKNPVEGLFIFVSRKSSLSSESWELQEWMRKRERDLIGIS